MNWMRTNRVFALVILGLGLLVISESGLIGERWVAARQARRQREKVSRELRALAALQPAPTAENARLIEADRVRTTRTLAELKTVLVPAAGSGPARELPVPAHRAEAFFELAEFVEAMRARARQAGVILRTDERFGFAGYAHEAPESGQLAAVLRERLRMQTLLEALLSCSIRRTVRRQSHSRSAMPRSDACWILRRRPSATNMKCRLMRWWCDPAEKRRPWKPPFSRLPVPPCCEWPESVITRREPSVRLENTR